MDEMPQVNLLFLSVRRNVPQISKLNETSIISLFHQSFLPPSSEAICSSGAALWLTLSSDLPVE